VAKRSGGYGAFVGEIELHRAEPMPDRR